MTGREADKTPNAGADRRMREPGVPGANTDEFELPCGETVTPTAFDLGMREYACPCGERHAVVLDVHPPSRFLPADVVAVLRETVAVAETDAYEEFGTPHLLANVAEEFPEEVTVIDAADESAVGYGVCWVASFDARTLHEHIVELVVEMMDHAVSHARDESARGAFEEELHDFDVEAFVAAYRAERDFEDEFDRPA